MISYEPLYETLKKRNISLLELSQMIGCSTNSIGVSIKKCNLNTYTLSQICSALKCNIADVIAWNDGSNAVSPELIKRVHVDWTLLNEEIRKAGYSFYSLAIKLEFDPSTFNVAKKRNSTIKRMDLINICNLINKAPSLFEVNNEKLQ